MKKDMLNKKIWIIGEQEGQNIGNNGFYLWKRAIKQSGILAYFVMEKSERNTKIFNLLSTEEKRNILWKDSKSHCDKYKDADALLVTLSYKDVVPSNVGFRAIVKPIIYLQHGILGIKKVGYKNRDYNGNLFRFVYFNPNIKDTLLAENLEEYQLEYQPVPPRFQQLQNIGLKYENVKKDHDLFFLTWREFSTEQNEGVLIRYMNLVVDNYGPESVKVIIHDKFEECDFRKICDEYSEYNIKLCKETNVQEEIASCNNFITDYSSVIWDATFLKKKSMLLCLDLEEYLVGRKVYLNFNEKDYVCKSEEDFKSMKENMELCSDFELAHNFTEEEIVNGSFIDEYVNSLKKQLDDKYTFIGYNFYGVGGTVDATKAMAQNLMKKRKRVELVSFTRTTDDHYMIPGVQRKVIFDLKHDKNPVRSGLNKKFIPNISDFDEKIDSIDTNIFNNYSYLKLTYFLKNNSFDNIISTNELYHEYVSKYAKGNKVYFYHTDIDHLEKNNNKLYKKMPEILDCEGMHVCLTDIAKEKLQRFNKNSEIKVIPNVYLEKLRVVHNVLDIEKFVRHTVHDVFLVGNKVQMSGVIFIADYEILEDTDIEMEVLDSSNKSYPAEFITTDERSKYETNSIMSKIKFTVEVPVELNKEPLRYKYTFKGLEILGDINIDVENKHFFKKNSFNIIANMVEENGKNYIIGNKKEEFDIKKVAYISKYMQWRYNDFIIDTSNLELNIDITEINKTGQDYVVKEYIDAQKHTLDYQVVEKPKELFTINNYEDSDTSIKVGTFLRITSDRSDVVDEILSFGNWIKENDKPLELLIYGRGDYVDFLLNGIKEYELQTIVKYCGFSNNVSVDMYYLDALVSFSKMESFGMMYMNAVMENKRIFTYLNDGSKQMYGEYELPFFDSYDELSYKLLANNEEEFSSINRKVAKKILGAADQFVEEVEKAKK